MALLLLALAVNVSLSHRYTYLMMHVPPEYSTRRMKYAPSSGHSSRNKTNGPVPGPPQKYLGWWTLLHERLEGNGQGENHGP